MKISKNFESKEFLFCHSLEKGNPDSSKKKLDSRSPRAGATSVDDFRGNDRGKYSTRNLPPTTYPPTSLNGSAFGGRGNLPPNKGFVMLFSVLIASLLVVVGLSIFNITLKEMTISTAGRESQVAFFAANSGLECALYWDLHENAFASNDGDVARAKVITTGCNGIKVNDNVGMDTDVQYASVTTGGNSGTTKFRIKITDMSDTEDTSCAEVLVEKKTDNAVPPVETIKIQSQGTNTCANGGRKVQRGLQATYTR